jgi:hypothetical protein
MIGMRLFGAGLILLGVAFVGPLSTRGHDVVARPASYPRLD